MKRAWIRIAARCPKCGFTVEAYIMDSRPYNPLVSQLTLDTEVRCARFNGKGETVGCGWYGVLEESVATSQT